MDAGQNDRPRARMTGSQIVEKILPEVRNSIDIQNEKFRLHAQHKLLRLLEAARHLDQRIGRSFVQDI